MNIPDLFALAVVIEQLPSGVGACHLIDLEDFIHPADGIAVGGFDHLF